MIIYGFIFLLLRIRDICSTRSQRVFAIGGLLFLTMSLSINRLETAIALFLGLYEILYTVRPIALFKTCTTSHLALLRAKNPGIILAVKPRSVHNYGLKLGTNTLIHRHYRQKLGIDGQVCMGIRRSQCYLDNLIDALLENNSSGTLYLPQVLLKHNLKPTLIFQAIIACFLHMFNRKSSTYLTTNTIVVTELSTNASAASCESEIDQVHMLSSGHRSENHSSPFSSLIERVRLIYEIRQGKRLGRFLRKQKRLVDKRKIHIPFTLEQITKDDAEVEATSPLDEWMV